MDKPKLLIFEDNLMWSVRVKNAAQNIGWEVEVFNAPIQDTPAATAAIINLGVPAFAEMVAPLQAKGVHVIGHAGHKERPLLQFGRDSGCDQVVTNSSLAHHLPKILGPLAENPGTE